MPEETVRRVFEMIRGKGVAVELLPNKRGVIIPNTTPRDLAITIYREATSIASGHGHLCKWQAGEGRSPHTISIKTRRGKI